MIRWHNGNIYKLVVYDEKEVKRELFELGADPTEKENLIDTADGALLQELQSRFDQHFH